MSAVQNAAADVTGDFISELQQATPGGPDDPAPAEEPTEEPEPQEEEEPAAASELPDHILALLAEDDEEEPEEEPETAAEPEEDYLGLVEPDEDDIRRRLHKAEKRARFLEQQQVKQSLAGWRKEAKKYFPFADVENIEASSKRQLFRLARAEHEIAKRGAAEVQARYESELERIVSERIEKEKERLQAAWGTPTAGPGQPPVEAAEKAQEMREINEAPTLADRTILKLKRGLIQI